MGNRSSLSAYIKEDNFNEKELKFYKKTISFYDNEIKHEKKDEYFLNLYNLFNEASECWDKYACINFPMSTIADLPYVDYLDIDNVMYYRPIMYSLINKLEYDCHNIIPDYYLILFSIDEYKNIKNIKGFTYANIFYTSREKALCRLKDIEHYLDFLDISITTFMELKANIESLPKESILELNFDEVIKSKENPQYKTVEYYLNRVKEFSEY